MKIAITGHRDIPSTMKQGVEVSLDILKLRHKKLELICGGAKGVDTIAALWARKNNVPYTLCYPCPYNDYTNKILKDSASGVIELYEEYKGAWQFQKRNEFMIDRCDILMAFYDGRDRGGTRNAIKYAMKTLKPIIMNKYKGE